MAALLPDEILRVIIEKLDISWNCSVLRLRRVSKLFRDAIDEFVPSKAQTAKLLREICRGSTQLEIPPTCARMIEYVDQAYVNGETMFHCFDIPALKTPAFHFFFKSSLLEASGLNFFEQGVWKVLQRHTDCERIDYKNGEHPGEVGRAPTFLQNVRNLLVRGGAYHRGNVKGFDMILDDLTEEMNLPKKGEAENELVQTWHLPWSCTGYAFNYIAWDDSYCVVDAVQGKLWVFCASDTD
eukprot:TRINITY_DN15411_c0_g1_i1.p1 TRINITY_DN15411_c0_g1~~TRINITY_DN15411_c0_g1_i1.p1  ORF type:complete len:250 (-),score=29.78 TRINITY_DN15411_c0_g1_i1:63-782(-)